MFFKLFSDSSVPRFASWLPTAALYARNQTAVFRDQDPEYSRAQQILFYLRLKFLNISSLRKKFAEIRNSGKRSTLHTISNIFTAIVQRGASRRQRQVVVPVHTSEQKQIASA